MACRVTLEGRLLIVACDMPAPAELAWRCMIDTRTWSLWGPLIRGVDGRGHRLHWGFEGRIRTVLGCRVRFRVAAFEEGRYWDWVVAGVRATGHRVMPLPDGCSRMGFSLPVWAAPYGLVCLAALRNIRRLLAGGCTSPGPDRVRDLPPGT